MRTSAQILGEKGNLVEKAGKIRDRAVSESRGLEPTEASEIASLLDQADKLGKEADGLALADRLSASLADLDRVGSSRTTPKDGSLEAVRVGREMAHADPKKGFRKHQDFYLAVMEFGRGRKMDPRLRFLHTNDQGEIHAAVGADENSTFSDPHGGFLVPEAFAPDILKLDPEADPMGALTMKIPMATPTLRIPSRVDKNHATSVSGGLRVYRRAEADTVTESRIEYEQVVLEAHTLFGVNHTTEELLADSPISVAALLAQSFQDEFTSKIVDERVSGTGVGEFLGVLISAATISVAKEAGQAADTVNFDNVVKMRSRCWGYGKAIWLANHDTVPQLMRIKVETSGGEMPAFMISAREDVPDMLFGRPIIFTEHVKKLGDLGDIILGNWSQYLEGMLQPLQSAESIHVRFVNHERSFKFWMRNAGAPWWRSVLTPKNGAATLSPFVTLAERA